MSHRELKVAMVAGELSGDLLGAGLIHALKAYYPSLQIQGVCGPRMLAQGAQTRFPMEQLSVMGIFEVLKELGTLLSLRKQLIEYLIDYQPDVYIGIDAPDFNLPIARQLRSIGIPTVHYVSPSVWAWRQGRIKSIAKSVELMLTLFPFEANFYTEQQMRACFVGHPLADEIELQPIDARLLRTEMDLPLDKNIITILPGSRVGEIKRLAPPFLAAAASCYATRQDLHFLIAVANDTARKALIPLLDRCPGLPLSLVQGDTRRAMAAADFLMATSGTVTLEGLLLKKPMIVAYRISSMTYWLVKSLRLMKIDRYSLPNLLDNSELVDEYIQRDAVAPKLAQGLLELLEHPQRCQEMVRRFFDMHKGLRRDASQRAAAAVHELINNK